MTGTCALLPSAARWAACAALALWAVSHVDPSPASAAGAGPFASFAGNWRGGGQISLSDGHKEPLKCKATYRPSAGGDAVSNSLKCASDSYSFELASEVAANGNVLSGSWRETTRGVDGTLSGSVARGRLQIEVRGPSFSAGLGISSNGSQQSIQIRSVGTEFSGADITLRRGG